MTQHTAARVTERLLGLPATPRQASRTLRLMAELRRRGWHRSIHGGAHDARGSALPWITYPAMDWLDHAITDEMEVFEYGSGTSTLWLAARARSVWTVEHDRAWASTVRRSLPANVHMELLEPTAGGAADDSPYAQAPARLGRAFDLVLVDGILRTSCVKVAVTCLGTGGLLVLDDSDRPEYGDAHDLLRSAGFGRVDFFGPRPGAGFMSTTSVFCQDFNPWLRGPVPSNGR